MEERTILSRKDDHYHFVCQWYINGKKLHGNVAVDLAKGYHLMTYSPTDVAATVGPEYSCMIC